MGHGRESGMDQHVFGTIKREYVQRPNQFIQTKSRCMPFFRGLLEDLFPHCEIAPFESEIDQQGRMIRKRIGPSGAEVDEESNHLSVPFRRPFALPSPKFFERVFCTAHVQ